MEWRDFKKVAAGYPAATASLRLSG